MCDDNGEGCACLGCCYVAVITVVATFWVWYEGYPRTTVVVTVVLALLILVGAALAAVGNRLDHGGGDVAKQAQTPSKATPTPRKVIVPQQRARDDWPDAATLAKYGAANWFDPQTAIKAIDQRTMRFDERLQNHKNKE